MSTGGNWRPRARVMVGACVAVVAMSAVACSSDDEPESQSRRSTPPGPISTAVDVSEVQVRSLPEGGGVPLASATVARTGPDGEVPAMSADYIEREYLVSGVARTYSGPAVGPATAGGEGIPYSTRVVVRMPADPSQFSGRVVMEPLNTSSGAELEAVWFAVGPMLEEAGDAWIGMTTRTSMVGNLRSFDAARYAEIDVPTNDLAWDMLRQVGGLIKQNGDPTLLPEVQVEHLYLGGYSQSGIDVATFASAFNESTRMVDGSPVFDGYLPAARSGSMAPLQSGTAFVPEFEITSMGPVDVPVVDFETTTDVEGFRTDAYTSPGGAQVRREDSDTDDDRFRLFEIAGAPHATQFPACDGGGSTFPNRYFLRAALTLLYRWAEEGEAPPTAPRLELSSNDGVVAVPAVDEAGNALGGVRSPFVDVPLVRYVPHSTPGPICMIFGHEIALAADVLSSRYGTAESYVEQFTASLDATIDAGFLREADSDEILDLATTQANARFGAAG